MAKEEYPITTGVRFLREHNISFVPRMYEYEEHGGTKRSSTELNVDEHSVIKTLVMESDPKHQFLVLMHGDKEVSTKQLARIIGVKQVVPASEASASRATGYQFGGTSPFGTRQKLQVFAEKTIFNLQKILINGGKRRFLVELDPLDLKKSLNVIEVNVAT
jgi:Cys-tRNA(Pro) deacylase